MGLIRRVIVICLLLLASTTLAWSGAKDETLRAQKILAGIPAAHNSTVLQVMLKNSISLKEGVIENIIIQSPNQYLSVGDTTLDIFFDINSKSSRAVSKGARTGLHAKFVKHKGLTSWEPINEWAKNLVEDNVP